VHSATQAQRLRNPLWIRWARGVRRHARHVRTRHQGLVPSSSRAAAIPASFYSASPGSALVCDAGALWPRRRNLSPIPPGRPRPGSRAGDDPVEGMPFDLDGSSTPSCCSVSLLAPARTSGPMLISDLRSAGSHRVENFIATRSSTSARRPGVSGLYNSSSARIFQPPTRTRSLADAACPPTSSTCREQLVG